MNTDTPDHSNTPTDPKAPGSAPVVTDAAARPDVTQALASWGQQMRESDRVVRAALDAIRASSPATSPEALIAAWTMQTAALMRVITDLTRSGLDAMEAFHRLLTRP
jgi:hypothetical protein